MLFKTILVFICHKNKKILRPKLKAEHRVRFLILVPRGGFEPYRFSTPIGYIFSQAQNIAQSGFESSDQNKKLGTKPSFLFRCPVEDSNLTGSVPQLAIFFRKLKI